jgi:hypothetical protein
MLSESIRKVLGKYIGFEIFTVVTEEYSLLGRNAV